MAAKYPPNAAHFDGNQVPTSMGVVGTQGTADTAGTALPLPFAVDPTTGAAYVNILQGSINIGTVAEDLTITAGTINRVGNIGTLESGTINSLPQISIGTLPTLNITTGTITRISTIGTLEVGTMTNTGTNVNIITGTITRVSNIGILEAGTISTGSLSNIAMLNAGTLSSLPQISVGTLPTLNLTTGTITTGSLTNLAMLHAGTISTLPQVSIGTIPQVSVGTLPTLNLTTGTITTGSLSNVAMLNAATISTLPNLPGGTLTNLISGTINALASGTITGGTIQNLNAGTITNLLAGSVNIGDGNGIVVHESNAHDGAFSTSRKLFIESFNEILQASGGTQGTWNAWRSANTANAGTGIGLPGVGILGIDTGGTYHRVITDTGGTIVLPNTPGGTLNLVTTLSNLTNGSINILTGTIQNSGTTTGVGVVSNLTNGSVNVLTGTIQSAGTVTGVGVVSSLTVGTVGGKAASGAAAVANPVLIGGTDSGGTVYVPLVNSAGALSVTGASAGTFVNIVTGSQQTLGTVGVLNNGTLAQVTTVSNLTNGSINVLTGTTTLVSTVTTLSNLTNGSVNVLTGTVTSLTNLAGGTIQHNEKPVNISASYGTLGTAGAATWGTLVAAAGAGTFQYVSGLSIVVASGTVDCAITNVGTVATIGGAGVLARGQFTPGGGIARTFTPVERSGTNGTIGYWLGGAGTAYFTVNYWQAT